MKLFCLWVFNLLFQLFQVVVSWFIHRQQLTYQLFYLLGAKRIHFLRLLLLLMLILSKRLVFIVLALLIFLFSLVNFFLGLILLFWLIIHPSPSPLSFYLFFDFIGQHLIVIFLNTLQPGIFVLIFLLKNEEPILIDVSHAFLFSHIERLNDMSEILHLVLNIPFSIFLTISVQSFL